MWCCSFCQYADPYYTETLTGKGGVAVFANMLILIKRRHLLEKVVLLSLAICCSLLYEDINWERWCCCLCQYADPYYTETLTGKDGVAVFANMLNLIIRRH